MLVRIMNKVLYAVCLYEMNGDK